LKNVTLVEIHLLLLLAVTKVLKVIDESIASLRAW